MKRLLFIILVFSFLRIDLLAQNESYADSPLTELTIFEADYPIHKLEPEDYIKQYVKDSITMWQEKGEFEKTSTWKLRVTEQTRIEKAMALQVDAETIYMNAVIQNIDWEQFHLSDYDADNETYLIKSNDFEDFALPVPLSTAKNFKGEGEQLLVYNPHIQLGEEKLKLMQLTFYDPIADQEYIYNRQQASNYSISDITYNFEPIDIQINNAINKSENNTTISTERITVGKADVDLDIPVNSKVCENTFVVIIANENYLREVEVEFALNDGSIFYEYCKKTLSIPDNNIRYSPDATYGTMKSEINWINDIAEVFKEEARIIFYYAGHGMPNEQNKEAYLLPTDGFSSDFETAISLTKLYQQLTEFPTKNVTVFLDACFSGSIRDEGMLANARSVNVRPKKSVLSSNIVVFTAASGNETAFPYTEKKHGLFTYFLLKKIKETSGNVSYKELSDYIILNVGKQSIVVNQKSQTPQVNTATDILNSWELLKLRL